MAHQDDRRGGLKALAGFGSMKCDGEAGLSPARLGLTLIGVAAKHLAGRPMGLTMNSNAACDLESVIATAELERRTPREPDFRREAEITAQLSQAWARAPQEYFQKLVDAALNLSVAESTGISILDEAAGRFVWPAVAGELKCYLGSGTPREFGPCGTVLDRDAAILFLHPERHFTYLNTITPPLEEVLLIPFHIKKKAVGTIWAVIHRKGRHFDNEDRRVLTDMSAFAATAYQVLTENGELEPIIKRVAR